MAANGTFHALTGESFMSASQTGPQARTAAVDAVRRLPAQLEYLAGVLSPEELAGRFLAGEWSAAQNFHHLADSHLNSYARCRLILTEEEPPLKPYDQERWAALPDAQNPDVTSSLQLLRGLHARWVVFWESLAPEDWARVGIHAENGPMTLEGVLQLYARHGEAHLEQIRRTVAGQYSAPPASHEELLARIDREWLRLNDLIRRMTPEQLEAPYQDGWSPKEHLGHVTDWERYLIGTVIGGMPPEESFGLDPAQHADELEFDQLNAVLVENSRNKTLTLVMDDFHSVHAAARAAVAAIDFTDWAGRTRDDGRPLLDWIAGNSYDHYLEHWQWLPVA
jgi:hypothetical protein